jgi:YD repeat-containing protein
VQYTYDPLGAVSAIQINDHEPVTIQRNPLGRIVEEHFSAFLQRSYGYSEEGLLTHQSINSVSGQIQRRYEYDPAGQLIARHDSHKGPWQFSYDPMGRISQATDPEHQVHRFAFDPAGDLIEHMPDIGFGLRCAKHNGTVYQYDAAGNLAERQNLDDHIRFTWDEHNRLATAHKADDTRIDMAYDALGRRHRKAVNGRRTFFTWDGDALLSEQFEDQAPREYVYYPGTFEIILLSRWDKICLILVWKRLEIRPCIRIRLSQTEAAKCKQLP